VQLLLAAVWAAGHMQRVMRMLQLLYVGLPVCSMYYSVVSDSPDGFRWFRNVVHTSILVQPTQMERQAAASVVVPGFAVVLDFELGMSASGSFSVH
jgi:hypothetical protein